MVTWAKCSSLIGYCRWTVTSLLLITEMHIRLKLQSKCSVNKHLIFLAFFTFYRATLCLSAVFAVVRCSSVCPSATLVHCIHRAEDIVKLLVRPGSPIILVFWPPAPVPNSKGNPFSGGAKHTRWENFCDFRLKSPFISETVRDRPMVAMEVNRKL